MAAAAVIAAAAAAASGSISPPAHGRLLLQQLAHKHGLAGHAGAVLLQAVPLAALLAPGAVGAAAHAAAAHAVLKVGFDGAGRVCAARPCSGSGGTGGAQVGEQVGVECCPPGTRAWQRERLPSSIYDTLEAQKGRIVWWRRPRRQEPKRRPAGYPRTRRRRACTV